MLGAALSHLLPDSAEHFTKYYGEENEYPFAALYCGASLLVLWIVEQLVLGNHSHSVQADHHHDSEPDEETPVPVNKVKSKGEESEKVQCHHEGMPRPDIQHLGNKKDFVGAIVFLVALSLHSAFEGLGLGAENDTSGVYTTIVAVASHKALEAFALGLAIHRAKLKLWRSIVLIILYSLATPLGACPVELLLLTRF